MSHFFTKPVITAISVFGISLGGGCGPDPAHPGFVLEDGWVRAMPPGSGMTAAYGRFTYQGATPVEITSFRSDSYAEVSLHETVNENGVSHMQSQPGWLQAPDTTMVLEPGGFHLMLMKSMLEIHPGDTVGLTLIAGDGNEYSFTVPVEAR